MSEPKLFVWQCHLLTGYQRGTIAVAARDVDEARAKVEVDLDRWVKSYDGGSPYPYLFDEDGKFSKHTDDEEKLELGKYLAKVLTLVRTTEPDSPVVYWQSGGD